MKINISCIYPFRLVKLATHNHVLINITTKLTWFNHFYVFKPELIRRQFSVLHFQSDF